MFDDVRNDVTGFNNGYQQSGYAIAVLHP